jgi:hypothetical protein
VRVVWTDRMGQSNCRDMTLKVATAWMHAKIRSDPGVDCLDPVRKADRESVM